MSISWDKYFLKVAEVISEKSHCLSVKRGCVIVKDNHIIGTGYNGPPAGYPHCEWIDTNGKSVLTKIEWDGETGWFPQEAYNPVYTCPRKRAGFVSGEGLEFCSASHAEVNAIISAAKFGVSIDGAILYCNFDQVPCRECSKLIINSGIKKVVLKGETIKIYDRVGIIGKDLLDACSVEVKIDVG
jgi:dCMP deaminase